MAQFQWGDEHSKLTEIKVRVCLCSDAQGNRDMRTFSNNFEKTDLKWV